MGLISKKSNDGGASGSFVKRSVKKSFAFIMSTVIYGVFYSDVATGLFDLALKGVISWSKAFELAIIKSLQFGTLKAPEIVAEGFAKLMAGYPITAFLRFFLPSVFLFGAWFQIVSVFMDIIDMRESDNFTWIAKALVTVGFMIFTWMMFSGFAFFTGTELTFNATEMARQYGSEAVNNSTGGFR